jgi:DNA-binding protein H-NS
MQLFLINHCIGLIEFIIIAALKDFGLTHYWRIHMSSYQEILSQIEELKRKAEDVRQQEMSGAIAEIKRLMAQFGITSDDLGLSGRAGAAKVKSRGIVAPKYRDPISGKTWTGRGRRPGWVVDLETQGKSLDDCRIA